MTASEELLGPGSLADEATLRSRWPSSSPRPDGAEQLSGHDICEATSSFPCSRTHRAITPCNYGDLRRVGQGLFRLEYEAPSPATTASSVAAATERPPMLSSSDTPVDATTEWRWEGNVQGAVVRHLAALGIHRVADTSSHERGVDIDAARGPEWLLVEVKGYPSATYVRGPKG